MTHLNYGIRSDSGIGEHLKKLPLYGGPDGSAYFVGRFFYEMLFFIIVIVIMLGVVAGIIIDSFAELLEKLNKREEDIKEICFICGEHKDDLENESKNYEEHIDETHNIWHYALYIVGLKFIDAQDMNAINSYVNQLNEEKSISWFPATKVKSSKEDHHH